MRVLIAEDQVLLRAGLARLFVDGGHHVLATFGDADELLASIETHTPDLIVLDVRMPPTFTDEGTRAAQHIKRTFPNIGVLVLSQHVERTRAVSLVALGGFGYLLKDRVLDVSDFLDAAQRVADGGSALDPQVIVALLTAAPTDRLAALSDRERDVLTLMAQGLNNTTIARRLVVSERTVEGHVRHLMIKLDLPEDDKGHRRVMAVLAHLQTHPTSPPAQVVRRR